MQDFEKNRVEYVAMLEQRLQHMTEQVAKYKPLAEKWAPIAASELKVSDQIAHITFGFGGKRVTATVTVQAMQDTDATSMTSHVIDTVCEQIVKDALRPIVQPEVEKMMRGSKSVKGAGTW